MGQETKAIAVSLRPDNLAWLRQEKKKRFEATGQTHSMNRIISEIVYLHIKALGTKNVAPPISDRMTRPE